LSQGLATPVAQGTTHITATDPTTGIVSLAQTLTVTPAVLTSIAVTPVSPSILVAGTQQFVATGTYSDSTQSTITTTVTWASGTTTTATISNATGTNGLATGLAVGTTNITATLGSIVSPAQMLTVTSATQYAYATNDGAGTVSQYTIGPDGTLSPMTPATVPAGTNPYAVAVDSTGHYAYVANNGSANISQYTIGTGGALTLAATVAAGNGPNGITVNNGYVYVPNNTDGTVSQYSIVGGALQPLTPATVTVGVGAGTFPQTIFVNAAGTVAYVATEGNGTTIQSTIAVYRVTAGVLSTTATSTVGLGTAANPTSIVIDPTGTYLYVAELGNATIGEYSIGGGGALTPLSPASYFQDATSLTLGTAGNSATTVSLYATNPYTTTIVQLGIGFTGGTGMCGSGTAAPGQLCEISDLPLATTNGPWALAFDQTGYYAYVADRGYNPQNGTTISQFSVNGTGGVAALTPATVTAGAQPTSIVTSLAY
jgi:6-phosphogluconolactonase (cycloisomerase 2 family)